MGVASPQGVPKGVALGCYHMANPLSIVQWSNCNLRLKSIGEPRGGLRDISLDYSLDTCQASQAPWLSPALYATGTLPLDNALIHASECLKEALSKKRAILVIHTVP